MTDLRSSYIKNDFGNVIKTYVMGWRPVNLVELGVLDGYSTVFIGEGIKENRRLYGIETKLTAYDLFDDYQYKHGNKEDVEKLISEKGLSDFVNIVKGNAYEVYKDYDDSSVEFLHMDISNTGKVIHDLMEVWHPKLKGRCIVMIEGGSDERDNIEWMKKYNMPSIKQEIETNEIINKNYAYGTYFNFPSITVLLKNWW